jgi:hypothetical protein
MNKNIVLAGGAVLTLGAAAAGYYYYITNRSATHGANVKRLTRE